MKKIIVVSRNLRFVKLNTLFYADLSDNFELLFIWHMDPEKQEDVSEDFMHENRFKYIKTRNLSELCLVLFRNKNSICLPRISDRYSDWSIYLLIRLFFIPTFVVAGLGDRGLNVENKKSRLKNILQKLLFMLFIFLMKIGIFPRLDLLFLASKNKKTTINKFKRYKKIIDINSYHFDQALEYNDKKTEEFVVFLDSNTPYHLDQKKMGLPLIDKEEYYLNLSRVFGVIEKEYNLDVIICAHPKYDLAQSSHDYFNRLVVQYDTLEKISKAKLVLVHNSSSVNYAIVLKKPILILDANEFNIAIRQTANILENELGLSKVNFFEDDEGEIKKKLLNIKVNEKKYNDYIDGYLAMNHNNLQSSIKIITEELKKL